MEIDILFADADESLRGLYQDYFSRKGFRIETAVDDLECAAKVREMKPCFLIFDLELFTADSAVIRPGSSAFGDVPIVIVTGDDPPVLLSELTGIAVSNCFCKPYSFVSLLECMCASAANLREGMPAVEAEQFA